MNNCFPDHFQQRPRSKVIALMLAQRYPEALVKDHTRDANKRFDFSKN
jgi:hypothetical protein